MSNLSNLIAEVLSDDNVELEKDLLREFAPYNDKLGIYSTDNPNEFTLLKMSKDAIQKEPDETLEEFSERLKNLGEK